MKIKLLSLFLLLLSANGLAQSDFDELVKEGLHDRGEYDEAIKRYEEALKIDPTSALANYELALSSFSKEDYIKTIKYTDIVLDQNDDLELSAYILKGSALDMLGKTKESIRLFEKAIEKTEGHYLLFYNLGLNYFKMNELNKAKEYIIQAIGRNANHSSSHLMLANIEFQKGNKIPTLLSLHYFLLLEPTSSRSQDAYTMLMECMQKGISHDSEDENTINITLPDEEDNPFSETELMLALLVASKNLEENKGKNEDEMFVANTNRLFNFLGEFREENSTEIWWTFYTPFFFKLSQSDYMETYCKHVTQVGRESSLKWVDEHPDAIVEFEKWLNKL